MGPLPNRTRERALHGSFSKHGVLILLTEVRHSDMPPKPDMITLKTRRYVGCGHLSGNAGNQSGNHPGSSWL